MTDSCSQGQKGLRLLRFVYFLTQTGQSRALRLKATGFTLPLLSCLQRLFISESVGTLIVRRLLPCDATHTSLLSPILSIFASKSAFSFLADEKSMSHTLA